MDERMLESAQAMPIRYEQVVCGYCVRGKVTELYYDDIIDDYIEIERDCPMCGGEYEFEVPV